MQSRSTTLLGWITLVAILGALWVLFGEDPSKNQGGRGEKLFPELAAQLEHASQLIIHTKTDGNEGASTVTTITAVKTDTGWKIAQKGNYPANLSRIAGLLRGLARSERREPKTTNQDRFPDIGLGGSATRITVQDFDNNAIAELDMGRNHQRGDVSLSYAYKQGDTRAWVVDQIPAISTDTLDWLDTNLLDLDAKRLHSIQMPDTFLVQSEGKWIVTNLTSSESAAPEYQLSQVANVITALNFDDVHPKGTLETFRMGNPIIAETRDGLRLSLTLSKDSNDTVFLTLQAGGPVGIDEQAISSDTLFEINQINAKAEGFLFALDAQDAETLMQSRADFIQAMPEDENLLSDPQ